MATSRISTSSIKQGFPKSRSLLAGNDGFDPGATFLIQRVTATGGEASLNFNSIPSTYKHLQIRGLARDTATSGNAFSGGLQFNSDTGSNYASHYLAGDGSSATASGSVSAGRVSLYRSIASATATSGMFGSLIIDIIDYQSTSKNKTVRAFTGVDTNGVMTGNVPVVLTSGLYISLTAISSIQILCGFSGFAAGSTFALYGTKG